ncbi:uncharacterized protein A4U43_C05F13740 [Asparagus officinalis]|uniref:Uncharacterized protein n=1 Tax=Asparagus officinalis TaxID=4686 RepID=A0A5P1ERF2_ASPOF|nr:uncharacterized protein A4U43_C05F13740 [Asparagus officinalis]
MILCGKAAGTHQILEISSIILSQRDIMSTLGNLNSGPNVVDAVTYHIYNLGPGGSKELFDKMQDPFFLSQIAQTFKNEEETVKDFGPWSSAWIGEAEGAFNSGGPESGTFVGSFWYLDQLGMASKFNHRAYCRQALIGGNYALLDTQTFIPNPDYYR